MNRLVILLSMILLSGCHVVHHQRTTVQKPVTAETIVPTHKMETISLFLSTGTCCSQPISDEERAKRLAEKNRWYKEILSKDLCVTWPAGASVAWCEGKNIVRVTNTAENLLKIIKGMSDETKHPHPDIEMDVQIVAAEPAALTAVGVIGSGHIDVAEEKREQLLKRNDVRLLETFHIVTRNGQECVAKANTEYIYPTEYEISPKAATNDAQTSGITPAVVPANFEMREVGTCVQMVPEFSDLSNRINFMINVTVTGEPTWKDYSRPNPFSKTTADHLPMEQPFFPHHSLATLLTATADKTIALIMGGLYQAGNDPSGKALILFLTPHLIHKQDGNGFTPIRLAPEQ